VQLVNEEKYRNNAKLVSERFKDRPMSPAESVVYWTEYVVRHRGAPHLKSRAIDLMWYEYFLVDVIAAFLLMVFVILFVIYFSLKKIYLCALKYFQNVKKKCD
ncbi:UDP-glucuronosyltransferase 1-5-like, partial [Sipha flava]